MQPKVSILVPIYGVEKFIERCSRSLFEQTFEDIEYIFVNDCTPDKSISILESTIKDYPVRQNQIKIVHHSVNQGIAAVRNTCLDNANGEYILFVDSDDWIEKNMVELMYNKAISENADIVECNFYKSYEDQEICQNEKYSKNHIIRIKGLISYNVGTFLWKLLVKRLVYENHQIRLTPNVNIGEDYILSLKLYYYAQKVASISMPLYHYVQYNKNNYSRLKLKNIEDHIEAVREAEQFCIEVGIISSVKEEIDGRKFIIKTHLIIDKKLENFEKWKTTFPEANYAWRLFDFRLDYKIIYWLAEHHAFWAIRVIKKIKKLMKR